MNSRKRLEDLPHFLISSGEQGECHPTRYIDFKFHGTFNQTTGVSDGRCWLLLPERDCLIGDLTSFEPKTGAATFLTSAEATPDVLGASLPYVDGYWQAYHVWMVVEPLWQWRRVPFQRTDVVGELFEAEKAQMIKGREVKTWLLVRETGKSRGYHRDYPIFPGSVESQRDKIIAAGWDHEHCELCDAQINVGDYGFVDPAEHWVCESCHAKYVTTHDLSFLDSPSG